MGAVAKFHLTGTTCRHSTRIRQRILQTRWGSQNNGRCIWCGMQTWLAFKTTNAQAVNLLILSDGLTCDPEPALVDGRRASIEHVIPKAAGGDDRKANLACACAACNNDRGDALVGWEPQGHLLRRLPLKVQATFKILRDFDA